MHTPCFALCLLMALSCLSLSWFPYEPKNDLESHDLYGPVKFTRTYTNYALTVADSVMKGAPYSNQTWDEELHFDAYGNLTFRKCFDSTDAVRYTGQYQYDSAHRPVLVRYDFRDRYTSTVCRYDLEGHLLEAREYECWQYDSIVRTTLWRRSEYDSLGREISRVHIDSLHMRDSYHARFVYNYDGYLIQEHYDFDDDKDDRMLTLRYDANGHLAETYEHSTLDRVSARHISIWDRHHRLLSTESFKDNKKFYREVYEYDTDGFLVQKNYYEGEQDALYRITLFDTVGNITEEIVYRSGKLSDTVHYRYTYDMHHNWIKKVSYHDGTALTVEEREIHYWDRK